MMENQNLELRGFAPIGILEYWSAGMMGLDECYRFYDKVFSAFKLKIPLFHHSTIPCWTAIWSGS
jgi:hypothetical protein